MADETDHIPACHVITTGDEDNSTEKYAGKPRSSNKQVPHYLRASTGSCHDACKSGKPHEFKDKARRPWRRVSVPLPNGEKTVDIQIFVDKKVKKAAEATKLELSSAKVSRPANDSTKKNFPSSKKSPLHDYSKPAKKEAIAFTKSPPYQAPKGMKTVVRSPGKSSLLGTLKPVKGEITAAAKRDASSKRAFSNGKEPNASAVVLKPNGSTVKPSSSPEVFSASSGKKTSETKVGDNPRTYRVAVKKVLAPPTSVLPLKKTTKVEVKKISDPKAATLSCPSSLVKSFGPQVAKKRPQKIRARELELQPKTR